MRRCRNVKKEKKTSYFSAVFFPLRIVNDALIFVFFYRVIHHVKMTLLQAVRGNPALIKDTGGNVKNKILIQV